jgi:hypothetical protein
VAPGSLPEVVRQLRDQRLRIAALASKSIELRANGKRLLAQSSSLAEAFEQSRADLSRTYLTTEKAAKNLRLRGPGRGTVIPFFSRDSTERVLIDSPDMVEALQQAAEILAMEFAATEGSGRETLMKCESVLKRAQSIRTIELSLY